MRLFPEKLRQFAGYSFRCRLAWIVAALHARWFLISTASLSPPSPQLAAQMARGENWGMALFAGRTTHFSYDPLIFQALTVADFPSLLALIPIALVLAIVNPFIRIGYFTGSYIGACLQFAASSVQWLLFGGSSRDGLRPASGGLGF